MLSACRFSISTELLVALTVILLLIAFTTKDFRSVPPSKHLAKATITYPSLPNPHEKALALHHELGVPIMKGGPNMFYFTLPSP